MKHNPLTKVSVLAAAGVFAAGFTATAADPYDKALEARVAALERELNVMQGDSKGKGIKATDVPTFLRAKSKEVKELTISGDMRLRYQYQDFRQQLRPNAAGFDPYQQSSRPTRYRLRINFEYVMSDNFTLGWSIASGDNRSNDGTTATIANGFGKNDVFIDKAYLNWKIMPNFNLIMGKQDLPLYVVDDFIYDKTDLRPSGLTWIYKTDLSSTTKLDLIAGQYIFADNVENRTAAAGNTDTVLFLAQAVFDIKPSNALSFKIGPTIMFYANSGGGTPATATGPGTAGVDGILTNSANFSSASTITFLNANNTTTTANYTGKDSARNLVVFSLPMEANFKLGGLAVKPFMELAYNFQGGARSYRTYGIRADDFSDKFAMVAGIRLGSLSKKGDWTVAVDYRRMGLGSHDPNLNDPNWAQSMLNTHGFKVSAGYRFTNWLTGVAVFYQAWNIEKDLFETGPLRRRVQTSFARDTENRVFQLELNASF